MRISVIVSIIYSTLGYAAAIRPWHNPDDDSSCPPIDTLECGETYEGGVFTLGQDLICNNGNITEADGSRNAAIHLNGTNTVLDCNGYTISQITPSVGSAADCTFPAGTNRTLRKQACGLFYFFGIIVEGGATVRNCNVQQFYIGASIEGKGEIEDSDFTLNYRAVQVGTFPSNGMAKVRRR